MVEADKFADVETGSSRTIIRGGTQLAVFKLRGKYYATQQMCPHKRTFGMSDGLIGEVDGGAGCDKKLYVSCPYHKRNFQLNGEIDFENKDKGAGSCSNDTSMSMAVFAAEERDDGWVYLKLPPVQELDNVLGTSKWVVKEEESSDPFSSVDQKLGLKKGLRTGRAIGGMPGTGNTSAGRTAMVNAAPRIDW
jgi:nitrite reductase (NAD(P)H)